MKGKRVGLISASNTSVQNGSGEWKYCYNAYCQFSQQVCTNLMQIYLYLLISTCFFILTTNLHWQMTNPKTQDKKNDLENSLFISELLPYLAFWSQLFTFWPTLHSTPLCQCPKSWYVLPITCFHESWTFYL